MTFPQVRIPKPNFWIIKDTAPLRAYFLLRSCKESDRKLWDEVTGRLLSEAAIELEPKNLKDHSTSLLGTFQPDDDRYVITTRDKDRRNYLVFEPWPEGEPVEAPPAPGEFLTRGGARFCYSIAAIDDNEPFEYNDELEGTKHTASLRAIHTPCRSNYWHFSVRTIKEDGTDIATRYLEKPNRKVTQHDRFALTTARNNLRELARREVPDYEPVPIELYTV